MPPSTSDAPQQKRIVICCDGTWQSSATDKVNIPSNVTRLCRHLARTGKDEQGRTVQQIVFYDSGIGTGALTDFERKRQGGLGDGLAVNVIEAYNFIALNYQKGDEIFCFGFSRGAYTARAVAGLVNDIGVLGRRELPKLPELYAQYKKNKDGQPFTESQAYKDFVHGKRVTGSPDKWEVEPHPEFEIHAATLEESRIVRVVGVWDTVGALGVPNLPNIESIKWGWQPEEHAFHNVRLSEHTSHAFHALALDEHRAPFSPTLWFIPHKRETHNHVHSKGPHLLQVWFPGVHINCGGGSDDLLNDKIGDLEQISNITFAWMLEQVRPYLAFEAGEFENDIQDHEVLLNKVAKEPVPETWGDWFKKYTWRDVPVRERKVNRGWATGPIVDSYTGWVMRAQGSLDRAAGEGVNSEGKLLSTLGDTCEQIHPTVTFRDSLAKDGRIKADPNSTEDDLYTPRGLKGWKLEKAKTGFRYTKSNLVLPEYVIQKGQHNFERLAVSGEQAEKFLAQRDAHNFR